MTGENHAEQGLRDAIDAMRAALASGDAWSAANPDFVNPDSREWVRWTISQDRLRTMVEEYDFAAGVIVDAASEVARA